MGQGADEIKRKAKEAAASAAIDALTASNTPASLSLLACPQYKTYMAKLAQPPPQPPAPPPTAPPTAPPTPPTLPLLPGATSIPGPAPPPNRPPSPHPPPHEPPPPQLLMQQQQQSLLFAGPGGATVGGGGGDGSAGPQPRGNNHPPAAAPYDHAAANIQGSAAMTRVYKTFGAAVYYIELPPAQGGKNKGR